MGRLERTNLEQYLKETYEEGEIQEIEKLTLPIRGLNQGDYGKRLDCTIVSITMVIRYYCNYSIETQEIYDFVEKTAKKLFYNGETGGTPFIVIKAILDTSLKHFGLEKSRKQYLIKEHCVGYTFDIIKRQLNLMRPIILSMKNDGRNYYVNHTVTVMGYIMVKVGNRAVPILQVLDNWTKLISYIDYNKLSVISSINF